MARSVQASGTKRSWSEQGCGVLAMLMLICGVLASLALGVLIAYAVCMSFFGLFQIHARQVAAAARPVAVRAQVRA